jgi:Tannase and feruloyl esterase
MPYGRRVKRESGSFFGKRAMMSGKWSEIRRNIILLACLLSSGVATPLQAEVGSQNCQALAGHVIEAAKISLPTTGAKVTEAVVASAPNKYGYCKVKGLIDPVDPNAWPIQFQLNLPLEWNGKFLQYGGGGLNGFLVTGLDPLRDAPAGPSPLEQGYATGGTDAGHPLAKEIQVFALNDEALANHAYAAYKKVYDVFGILIRDYYGKAPMRRYFIGGSEGGREGLLMAQRYPDAFDGIVSTVPVLSWTGVNLAGYNQFLKHRAGGAMSPQHVQLWQDLVVQACDARDGLKDGLVARYKGCPVVRTLEKRRCKGKAGEGLCFTEAQLALVRSVAVPYEYGVTLANGERSLPPYGVGGEAARGNIIPVVVNAPGAPDNDVGAPRYSSGDIRYFIARDPAYVGPLDMAKYGDRTRQVSALMDMNDPDLSRFKARGGKLLMRVNTADTLVSPGSVWRYYEAVQRKMGRKAADSFIRLFVSPGTGHGGSGAKGDGKAVPDKFDMLTALDTWVETGQPPIDPILTAFGAGATEPDATLPFCRYPAYPHYDRKNDPEKAGSYACKPA